MNNAQSNNDSQAKAKASLRGEAPQEHGVKSKGKSSRTQAARRALCELSQEAKGIRQKLIAKAETELEQFKALALTINDVLLAMYEEQTGCKTFKTFHDWKKAGYKVKKGEIAFRIWGKPRQIKETIEDEKSNEPENEGYEFWPMCCLFNESQVEKIEEGAAPAGNAETEAVAGREKVKVAEFRDAIEHLERVFNVDRHACVGEKEKVYWRGRCERVLAALEGIECPRAKQDDLARRDAIVKKVKAFLSDNPEPTPPKPTKKDSKEVSNAGLVQHTQDMGNNETLTRGLFPQANGEFLAMTYTESETFKTEAGAVNWLACRGLDATGQRIEHNEPVREGEGPEASPFVTIDYQEQQEARKDRLQDRAKRAHTESEATYNQAKAMASVIPFGQPILVGHHSEQRDRRYRERIHNTFGQAFALDDKAKHYERKAANIGNSGIASNDPEAIKKLKAKLQKLENLQMLMKLANKALKKGDNATLAELGFDEGQIAELRKPDFAGRVGFASYQLQNNGAEIRRTKKRIEELELLRNSKPLEFENEDFSICIDNGRVVVKFPGGKPSAEVCSMMKAVAFKWSRYQGAWVRKATGNAVADAGRFLEFLKTKESIY